MLIENSIIVCNDKTSFKRHFYFYFEVKNKYLHTVNFILIIQLALKKLIQIKIITTVTNF